MTLRQLCGAIALAIGLGSVSAQAQPSISGTSGTFGHGQSVTISGSSFGTRSVATPFCHDDFSTGTLSGLVRTTSTACSGWLTETQQYEPTICNTKLRANTPFTKVWCSHWNAADPTASGASNLHFYDSGITFRRFLIDYWVYYDTTGASGFGSLNNKTFRVHVGEGSGTLNEYVSHGGTPSGTGDDAKCHANDGSLSTDIGNCAPSSAAENGNISNGAGFVGTDWYNKWWHLQVIEQESTGGTADGTWIVYINGRLWYNRPGNVVNSNAANDSWQSAYFGNYLRTGDYTGDVYGYIESLHFDYGSDAWARVEICDTSSRSTTAHCELSKTTAWSSSSVTVTLNRGSFTAGTGVYIFLCDANNSCNATGFGPVTLDADGGGGGASPVYRLRFR